MNGGGGGGGLMVKNDGTDNGVDGKTDNGKRRLVMKLEGETLDMGR